MQRSNPPVVQDGVLNCEQSNGFVKATIVATDDNSRRQATVETFEMADLSEIHNGYDPTERQEKEVASF